MAAHSISLPEPGGLQSKGLKETDTAKHAGNSKSGWPLCVRTNLSAQPLPPNMRPLVA